MERIFLYFGFVIILFFVSGQHQIKSTDGNNNNNEDVVTHSTKDQHVKTRTFYDFQTHAIAYKDLINSQCYIQRMQLDNNSHETIRPQLQNNFNFVKKLHMTDARLSKQQIYSIAGSRIVEFCLGFPTYLLQEFQPDLNELEFAEKINELSSDLDTLRKKRSSHNYLLGRAHGQTQSQYLHFGGNGKEPGKAEAEASFGSSKAIVSKCAICKPKAKVVVCCMECKYYLS